MKLEGLEPPVFGSGIRRATNYAIASHIYIYIYTHIYIYVYVSREYIFFFFLSCICVIKYV